MDKTEKEIQMGREALVTNSYYMLVEASCMMLRYLDIMLNKRHATLTKRVKERHKFLMQKVADLKVATESFDVDYHKGFDDYHKWDSLRQSSAYIARLLLLIADRTMNEPVAGERERKIEEYIYFMSEGGLLTDEMLNYFRIR